MEVTFKLSFSKEDIKDFDKFNEMVDALSGKLLECAVLEFNIDNVDLNISTSDENKRYT